MSLSFPPAASLVLPGQGVPSTSLSERSLTVLSTLLYQTSHHLHCKSAGVSTLALTVNQICQAIIQAYAAVFEERLGGSRSKPTFQIFLDRQLTVNFSIKGSTVAKLLSEHDMGACDLDTSLDFSLIPIPAGVSNTEEDVQKFFSSHDGRSFLREFYFEVAYEATRRLLRFDNETKKILNHKLLASGHALHPILTEETIETLKDQFFNNLLLFAGNSTFLITFGSIDFAIKVPCMNASNYVHRADSLTIHIPVEHLTCHLALPLSHITAACDLKEAFDLLKQKVILISNPYQVKYNGFERIIYSITQGWTVLEKDCLYVLLKELVERSSPEYQMTPVPLERFFALILKKKNACDLSENFILRMLLNAYRVALEYKKDGVKEGDLLIDLLNKVFAFKDYQELFPSFVKDHAPHFSNLQILLKLETLKLHLSPQLESMTTFASHLQAQACVIGDGSKKEGSLITSAFTISELLHDLQFLKSSLPEELLNILLEDLLKDFEGSVLDLEAQVFVALFKHHIPLVTRSLQIKEDVLKHEERLIETLSSHPDLLENSDFKKAFSKYVEIFHPDFTLVKKLLPNQVNIPVIPLVFEVLSLSSSQSIKNAIVNGLTRKSHPVDFKGLIGFLLGVESEDLEPLKCFKFIEQAFKAAAVPLSFDVVFHPKISWAFKSPKPHLYLDQKLWKEIFKSLFLEDPAEEFCELFYPVAIDDIEIFQSTLPYISPENRFHLLKRLIADQKSDLICMVLMHGILPKMLEKLVNHEERILDSKAFKHALLLLPEIHFCYLVEELISLDPRHTEHALMSLMDSSELFLKLAPFYMTLIKWAELSLENSKLNFHLLKLLVIQDLKEENAIFGMKLLQSLDLSKKQGASLFKQFIDKFGPLILSIEETAEDDVKELIISAKKQSISLINHGICFAGAWNGVCLSLKHEMKSLEERLIEAGAKPTAFQLMDLCEALNKRKEPLSEQVLDRLKERFQSHGSYLIELFKHIGIFYCDRIKERFAKEIYSSLKDEACKQQLFHLYIQVSESLKHLSVVIQSCSVTHFSVDEAIELLEKLFVKASDELKTTLIHKFKDNQGLKDDHLSVLFEYFKRIPPTHVKRNSLLDYFYPHIAKLKVHEQQELVRANLILEQEPAGIKEVCLLDKASSDFKALDSVSMIISRRGQAGFHLATSELLEILNPVFENCLDRYIHYTPKHQESCLKFFEKLVVLYKDGVGHIPRAIFESLMAKVSYIPLHDIIRDLVCLDLETLDRGSIFAFLHIRKTVKSMSKSDAEKYLKILKHLVLHSEIDKVYPYFDAFSKLEMFQDLHKKELVPLLIAQAITQKDVSVIFQIFGSTVGTGFKTIPTSKLSFLKEISKASKKTIYDALLECLESATDMGKLNIEVLGPLKFVSETVQDPSFQEIKRLAKDKMFAILDEKLLTSRTIRELDFQVLNPFKNAVICFDPCPQSFDFLKALFKKFLLSEPGCLEDTNHQLEGFTHILIAFSEICDLKYLQSAQPVIDLSNEKVREEVIELLILKLLELDKSVSLMEVLKKLRIYKVDLIVPFLKQISLSHPHLILEFIEHCKEEDLVVLIKTLRSCPDGFYKSVADVVSRRTSTELISPMVAYAHETMKCNFELFNALVEALKLKGKETLYAELLACSFEVFAGMLHRCFDLKTDMDDIVMLLECRRQKEGYKFYTFIIKLKDMGSLLYLTFLNNLPLNLYAEFFMELEEARIVFGKSILAYTNALSSVEPIVAKMFFLEQSKSNAPTIIEELKVLEFHDYFTGFLVIYNYWIVPNRHKELYPAILDDAMHRIQSAVALNHAKGDLDASHLQCLFEILNCLCLSYNTTLEDTGYPMAERFNGLFIEALSCILEPKNILKNHMAFIAILSTLLRSIKSNQIDDLLTPRYFGAVEQLFRSMLRFISMDVLDYVKNKSLSRMEFEMFISTAKMQQEVARQSIVMHLLEDFMPKLITLKIDLFIPFITMLHGLKPDHMTVIYKKRHFRLLKELLENYLKEFKEGYNPVKTEVVIAQVLSMLDSKKVAREKREHNALIGIYNLPAHDLSDYVYHSCQKLLKQAQEFLG